MSARIFPAHCSAAERQLCTIRDPPSLDGLDKTGALFLPPGHLQAPEHLKGSNTRPGGLADPSCWAMGQATLPWHIWGRAHLIPHTGVQPAPQGCSPARPGWQHTEGCAEPPVLGHSLTWPLSIPRQLGLTPHPVPQPHPRARIPARTRLCSCLSASERHCRGQAFIFILSALFPLQRIKKI